MLPLTPSTGGGNRHQFKIRRFLEIHTMEAGQCLAHTVLHANSLTAQFPLPHRRKNTKLHGSTYPLWTNRCRMPHSRPDFRCFPPFLSLQCFWASFSSITMIRTGLFLQRLARPRHRGQGKHRGPAHWRQTSSRAPFSSERTAFPPPTGPISSVRMWLALPAPQAEAFPSPLPCSVPSQLPLSMNRLRRSLIQQPV